MPANTVFALAPPSSPAKSTSAQAVPSGYGSTPCSFTISALRSGIINSTPRTPPTRAINEIVSKFGASVFPSFAHKNKAGSVKIAPAAKDSPAEPIVCTILLSKIESFFIITRITPIEITAAGIDAETVIPTRKPRYAFAAPKITASKTPMMIDVAVNSGVTFSAGIYGLNFLFSIIVLLLIIPHTDKYIPHYCNIFYPFCKGNINKRTPGNYFQEPSVKKDKVFKKFLFHRIDDCVISLFFHSKRRE